MEKLNTGLTEKDRFGSVELLNHLLADEYVLYTKTRKYHWNVRGMQFKSLHELFEEHYRDLEEKIDEIAERIRALGHYAIGTLKQFSKLTRLEEHEEDNGDARSMLQNLVYDHELIINHLRSNLETCQEKYHDAGTSDFFTSMMKDHEKMVWMLRVYLE
ncbi:DNA starvation/stationary phase protection protein [Aquimarina sp. U1-2]|uniref:Dps family protein n=1 Tax=Aquimarina sp. U1-2 TaxID=2823141 RepID=UPI001AEC7688|nr:DNA starvation/stationary phase protection protein [Aquimarina sp. U1-2]MBP2831238.1 DNA starvation/stationary phase protection protein [Aquimarina sp. U1-2]